MRFDERLLETQRQLQKTQEALYLTLSLENKCQFESAYDEALHFAVEAEKLTMLARNLPAYTGHPKAREAMDALVEESIPVSMEFTPEGWFKMSFPALLPRKERGNTDYICGYLYPAMKRFRESGPPVYFGNSVIIFRHLYDHTRPERLFRDHDNIEINAVVDVLALYMLHNDGPMTLQHYYCSAACAADGTEVYLVPQDEFDRFLIDLKAGKIGAPAVKATPP